MTLTTSAPLRWFLRSLPRWSRLAPGALALALVAGGTAAAAGPEEVEAPPEATAAASKAPAPPPTHGVDDPAVFLPSLDGPIGLYHMSTADVGPEHHLRFGLHGQYFSTNNVVVGGDSDSMLAGSLTLGFTPVRYLEIFGGILTSSNRNTRMSEAGRTDQDIIRAHGDLLLGPKLAVPVATGTAFGFEAGVRFLASASSLSFSPSSTSLWFGPLATLDLRPLVGVPVRLHVNGSFYLDNSKNVYDLSTATPESRQTAKFAYGIGASRVRLAAGIDLPLEKYTGPVPLRPFAEYHAEIVTAAADPALVDVPPLGGPRDRQWLTFGLRTQVYRGATLDVGADVRLRSTGLAYEPPLPPYAVIFGASYPLDVDAFRKPVVVTQVIEKKVEAPPTEGRIAGVAKDKSGKGIGHAIVAVAGRPHASVVTDADGTFEIAALAPGPANVVVEAANFEGEKVMAMVTAGQVTDVALALTPKARTGSVRGKTTDAQGHAVEATLKFSGAQALETRTDGSGLYQAALLPGPYKVVAEAPGLPTKESEFEVVADANRQIDLMLRPLSPDLTLTADEILLRAPIKFKTGAGAPKLVPEWQAELDGVVAVLEDRPEIRVLRVEAHWDPSAGPKAKEITDAQAAAVKDYLVKKGIAEARIEAVGMGADQPLVPNVTPVYKAKNRRLELHMIR
jgi:outer membrane protein OmpA-like peptidoglycan-associated protein